MKSSDPRHEIVEYLPALRAFAISLTGNRTLADDIIQDTMVKAWTNFHHFKQGTNLRAWLFTILRNTYYSDRRRARLGAYDETQVSQDTLVVKPDHDGYLQMKEFVKALEKLPTDQREALILVGASGFSYEEAAEMCGVPIGTIKSRINRARARLAELMQFDGDGPEEITDRVTQSIVNGTR
jgi:RNA polymerase sigma-70 factor (ECF subfamily)